MIGFVVGLVVGLLVGRTEWFQEKYTIVASYVKQALGK